jgi:hypothetical protein
MIINARGATGNQSCRSGENWQRFGSRFWKKCAIAVALYPSARGDREKEAIAGGKVVAQ